MSRACRGWPVPLMRPRLDRMVAIWASVWSSSSSSMADTTSGGVWRSCQAASGIGRCRLWSWPPRRRTWAVIWSVLVRVTSLISSRMRRLRSRWGVAGGGLGGVLVGVGGVGQLAQRGVPVGLQAVGHQPVLGVDRQVAAAGQVGLVAGTLDGSGADPVGLVGAGDEFFGDGERGLDGQRGEGVDQQAGDGGVDGDTGDALADGGAVADPFGLADILGHLAFGSGVVAHRHAGAAAPADDQALQQRA